MNNFKKPSKVLFAITFVVSIILVVVLTIILINQNTEIQNLKTILREKLLENISVGGYQYAPAVTEALSTSTTLLQKDDNNIILLSYLVKDSNLLKFSNVTNISTCKEKEASNNAGVDLINLKCTAKVLAEDSVGLNKIVETVKSDINELLIKNY